MISCEQHQDKDTVMVTFSQPNVGLGGSTSVVGDFNGWDPTVTTMSTTGEHRAASVIVQHGNRYAFRYLDHDAGWFNDEAAHAYEPNSFGGDNCVVDLTGRRSEPKVTSGPKKTRSSKA